LSIAVTLLCLLAPSPGPAEESAPTARAFVYPIGNEQDFTKPAPGELAGFHVSSPYLAVRQARKRRPQRIHYGVDLSAGSSGPVVRAIAAGVVDVSDGNALIKVRKAQTIKLPKVVDGKQVYANAIRYRTAYRWRTGWGNRVVIRHTVNPLSFLEDHVMRFEDLEPGSWQSRYALAAIKDGVIGGSKRRFDPDDSISREAFYAALVSMFHLGTPFTKDEFRSSLD